MRAKIELPSGYEQIYKVDLANDKKLSLIINILAVIVMVSMCILGSFYIPITKLFSMEQGFLSYTMRFVILIVGQFVYIILHEAVHGIVMKMYGAKNIKFGLKGPYAFAGCEDFFDKPSYIAIALAPIVVLGIILFIITLMVSAEWFWVVYFIQTTNIGGAMGDLYVTCKFMKMPQDILVKDTGVSMTVYSKAK